MRLEILLDVDRQRQREKVRLAFADDSLDAARQHDLGTGLRRLARPHLGKYPTTGQDALDQDLHLATGRLRAAQPRPDHACVIEYQQVVGTEERRQFGESAILERRTDHQQPAVTALRSGITRDQLIRQLEIEVAQKHGRAWYPIRAR